MKASDIVILVLAILMLMSGVVAIIIGTETSHAPKKEMTPSMKRKARILQIGGILLFLGGIFVSNLIAR
jgi:hypothetical protein